MSKTVHFQGQPVTLIGQPLVLGSLAPDFTLTNSELAEVTLASYAGKRKVLSLFPSVDTPVCASAARAFNQLANTVENTVILCISADLPFAQARFCAGSGLENVVMLSSFRHGEFGANYGVAIESQPLNGLLTRAVIVLDEHNTVIAEQWLDEITHEPNYTQIIHALTSPVIKATHSGDVA